MDPTTADLLSHFRHEHLPAHLAAVSRRVGDVARDLAAGAPELAVIRLMRAAHELSASLPPGPELAHGLELLADASVGLPGDPEPMLRQLADEAGVVVPKPEDPETYARLRSLLYAKDALVRAEVTRPKSERGVLHDQRRES